ncbi:hypothetical protein EON65_31990 [archaeon]|nr:MAG: hypothetical protein EON65_31990 [archaeon]
MRAIEFYSGIGGWNCAIQSVLGEGVHVVSAYDVNPAANAVYAINNHSTRPSAKSLEVVTAEELDAYRADIWMMSPPCQPHTRNNTTSKRDDTDPRSASFSNLINQLDRVKHPPQFIILENVVGFETSKSCADFLSQLCDRNYVYEQYIISPIQCGVPNSRPRYYCLAWIPIEPNTAIHSDTMSTLFTDMPGVTSVEEVMTLDTYLEPADTDMVRISSPQLPCATTSSHNCYDFIIFRVRI